MNNYEKIAATPEALGAFLASLPVATGPWDECFHRTFCDSCEMENCDAENCPHNAERGNPAWWLMQEAEGGITEPIVTAAFRGFTQTQTARRVVWRNGFVELEPGAVINLQKEEPTANGVCEEFNVHLNGKGPGGKVLHNIEKVILPKISADEDGRIEPTDMKLVFGGCEDAAEIVNLLGEKCKLEIRAAVRNWNYQGQVEFHGHKYILEAVPLELKSEPLKRRAGTGLTVKFLVYRYTATVGDTQLWDFEWVAKEKGAAHAPGTQERQGDIHKTEKLFEEIKMKIMESDCTQEEAVEVLDSVRIALINVVKQAKEIGHA